MNMCRATGNRRNESVRFMRKLRHSDLVERTARGAVTRANRHPIIVLLDNIRSLYNVGSIFRTCDAANVEKLILTGYTPHPPRKEISKTALGAEESVPWEYFKSPVEAVATLKNAGVTICAVEQTDESVPYASLTDQHFPICLIVGNEISGVSDELIALADMAIEIPMHGVKHSLNVAVAAGIAIYAAVAKSGLRE